MPKFVEVTDTYQVTTDDDISISHETALAVVRTAQQNPKQRWVPCAVVNLGGRDYEIIRKRVDITNKADRY
jgi:hypothetical protein